MMRLAIVLWVGIGFSSPAGPFRLAGEPFHPNARLVWAATNKIPTSIMVYKVVPGQFSNEVLSNLLRITLFKPVNMNLSTDRRTLSWRYHEPDGGLVRSLDVAPGLGWIHYINTEVKRDDSNHPVTGVPGYEEVDKLAAQYLHLLGGDSNQLCWQPKWRTELDSSSYDKRPWKGGRVVQQQVLLRGVMLCREIDGIRFCGSGGGRGGIFIAFGNHAKLSDLQLNWRNLQAFQRCQTLTEDKIMKLIKAGKAVVPDPESTDLTELPNAKKLTIASLTPYYWGEIGGVQQDFVYPFAELQITADLTGTNTLTFVLDCPILSYSASN